MKYVVLLSGGLDSSTVLGIIRNKVEPENVFALSINYNQRHKRELESAKKIAEFYGVDHKIMNLDLRAFGGSALTSDMAVPTDRTLEEMGKDIPITYVPGRNTIFISLALSYAETIDADVVALGVNALDYSGYPDCRPEFIEKFRELSGLANKRGVEGRPIQIYTPIIGNTKAEIVKIGTKLKVPYEYTWSCYNGGDKACGVCDSCKLRLQGFAENGISDPIDYEVR
jgi:7-cyano-7-deazaguanine synthase